MTKNKESTRYYSDKHEKSVCTALNARQQSNSGAGNFKKGDVVTNTFLIECKTCMQEKQSISIKKEWLDKNREEAFAIRKDNSAICFNFKPNGENYYVINESLMQYLVSTLESDNLL